ncbi:MAG: hypothetical protein FJY67_10205 [Calditrichaeota bacterium]|nr:hypothetical protein [Calditrichota bacterium]
MDQLPPIIDIFLHLDRYLGAILEQYGLWTYLILFLVVFCETGLVVTPFLPGDSLLFVVGAFAAGGWLDIKWLFLDLAVAAILGNIVNYAIGSRLGPAVLERDTRFLKREYLDRTAAYFDKYGATTVVIARFLPILRTFAPFMAGVGRMNYARFTLYNFVGCLAWVVSFLFGGYFFGNIPFMKQHLTWVVLGIIVVSAVPSVWAVLRRKKDHSA